MSEKILITAAALVAACLVALIALTGADDYSEAVRQHRVYCDMVQDFIESNGERGWPDYQGTYGEYCDGY